MTNADLEERRRRGAQLKELRLSLGIQTPNEAATRARESGDPDLAKFAYQDIARIESGERAGSTVRMRKGIAAGLGVPMSKIDEILGTTDAVSVESDSETPLERAIMNLARDYEDVPLRHLRAAAEASHQRDRWVKAAIDLKEIAEIYVRVTAGLFRDKLPVTPESINAEVRGLVAKTDTPAVVAHGRAMNDEADARNRAVGIEAPKEPLVKLKKAK